MVSPQKGRLLAAVDRFLDGADGPARGSTGLLAVSGGPDSTALALALAEGADRRGLTLAIGHVDHGLRPQAAAQEAAHVRTLASTLGMRCLTRQVDVPRGANLEARARRARYRALAEMADEIGATWLALGHTRDDQAETVLMRLLRGSGRRGLGAMRPARRGVLRPLLHVGRADVQWYLATRGVRPMHDPSNASLGPTRNRLRHLVLPLLAREFDAGIAERLGALAMRLGDEDDLLDALASDRAAALTDGPGLAVRVGSEAPALGRRIVRTWLEEEGGRSVGARHVEAVLTLARGTRGGAVAVPGPAQVVRDGTHLVWRAGREEGGPGFSVPVAPGQAIAGPTAPWRVVLGPVHAWDASEPLPTDACEALFDASDLQPPLVLRSPHPGDRIHLPGVGTRKVQDVLVDRKVPRVRRRLVPVLTSGERILWLAGVARSDHGLVRRGRTERVVRARLEGAEVLGLLEKKACDTVTAEPLKAPQRRS